MKSFKALYTIFYHFFCALPTGGTLSILVEEFQFDANGNAVQIMLWCPAGRTKALFSDVEKLRIWTGWQKNTDTTTLVVIWSFTFILPFYLRFCCSVSVFHTGRETSLDYRKSSRKSRQQASTILRCHQKEIFSPGKRPGKEFEAVTRPNTFQPFFSLFNCSHLAEKVSCRHSSLYGIRCYLDRIFIRKLFPSNLFFKLIQV